MARRYNSRRGGYKRKRYTSSSSYGKRSYGQFKAAKQQADQASFVMNIPTQLTTKCIRKNLGDGKRYVLGTYPLNIYDLLRKSEFYQSYANMYDEFKIDNVKIKLVPIKYNVTVGDGSTGYQAFTVYTAWDRTGLNDQQLYLQTSQGEYTDEAAFEDKPNGPKKNELIGKEGDRDGLYCIVGDDIATYSSAEAKQISVGQSSTIVRWLKPKTISEKSQWLSTTMLKRWYGQYSTDDLAFKYIPISDNDKIGIAQKISEINGRDPDAALSKFSNAISTNPCFLQEDPAINFKPTLLVGLYPAEDYVEGMTARGVTFNIEAEISTSFRGLRRSKVVATQNTTDPDVIPDHHVEANRITVRLSEDAMDTIMNPNMRTRSIKTFRDEQEDQEYSELVIPDLNLLGDYVIKNQNGYNYATSIALQLPYGQEVTPIDVFGIAFQAELDPYIPDDKMAIDSGAKDIIRYIERVKIIYPLQEKPCNVSPAAGGSNDGYWEAAYPDEELPDPKFKAIKIYPNGKQETVNMVSLEIDGAPEYQENPAFEGDAAQWVEEHPLHNYALTFKVKDVDNGDINNYGVTIIKNMNGQNMMNVLMEVPNEAVEETRGFFSAIWKAFKGVMAVSRVVRDLAPKIGQVVGNIAGGVVSIGEKVEDVLGVGVVEPSNKVEHMRNGTIQFTNAKNGCRYVLIDDIAYDMYRRRLESRNRRKRGLPDVRDGEELTSDWFIGDDDFTSLNATMFETQFNSNDTEFEKQSSAAL